MSLQSVIRSAVKTADSVTKDLQATVIHRIWMSQDEFGAPVYKNVARRALVDQRQKSIRSNSGQLVQSRATVTFPVPIEVSPKDLIILPDGTSWPILDVSGLIDPSTGIGYLAEVSL